MGIGILEIIQGLLIGISIAAIPGPLFFEFVRRTLVNGFWAGAMLSVGELIGNFLLLTLIFLGVLNFFQNDIAKLIIYILGALVLIYVARNAVITNIKHNTIEDAIPIFKAKSNSLLIGFVIAITNPIVILLWISLSTSYLAKYSSPDISYINLLIISIGFAVFFFSIAAILHTTKRHIPIVWIKRVSKFFGSLMFLYALYFLFQAIELIIEIT